MAYILYFCADKPFKALAKLRAFLLAFKAFGGKIPGADDPKQVKIYKVLGLVVIMGSGALTYLGKITSSDFAAILFFVLPAFGFGQKGGGNDQNRDGTNSVYTHP